MRPIDADALKDRLQALSYDDWNQGVPTTWANAYAECADMVEDMPTIEPERKRGHWIEANDSYNRIRGRCSVCGWESHMYEDDVVGMNYCPDCGARMTE